MLNLRQALVLLTVVGGTACSNESAQDQIAVTAAPTKQTTTTATALPLASESLIQVPDLKGLNEDQAFQVLREVGLFATFTEAESSERAGSVILQTPRPGTEVEEGETVDVRIAIPMTRTIGVLYSIHDDLWQDLDDGKCEHRESSMFVGQSVTLLGPNGESLATALVEDGYVGEKLGDPTEDACMFAFQFEDVPEVQSYGMKSASTEFPQVPVSKVIEFGWNISWSVDKG